MITTINKVNKGLYNQLFTEVQEWLYSHDINGNPVEAFPENPSPEAMPLLWYERDGEGNFILDDDGNKIPETITSLDELFVFMDYLTDDFVFPNSDYSREQNHAWMYTRLPLDEEPFYIDANARTISVPSNFAKNGISVQGDEVAEILFFKINRFFDATDLATCQIYVQWKTSPADKDAESKSGVSRPWIVDIVSEPGYLIFGWPITSTITKDAGDITFSVRFYREYPQSTSRDVAYSFSTLDQKVSIKPALNYDIKNVHESNDDNVIIEDASTLISLRAVNSPDTSSSVQAADPQWSVALNSGRIHDTENGEYSINNIEGDIEHELPGSGTVQLIYLGKDADGFTVEPIFIHAQAVSDDSGVVTYKWTKADINGNSKLTPAGEVPEDYNGRFYKSVDYIETQDAARVLENKTYYYKTDLGAMKVLPLEVNFVDGVADDPYGQVYDQVSTAILDEIGNYRLIVTNRVGRASASIYPDPIRVPGPVAPVLTGFQPMDGSAIMTPEHNVVLGFQDVELKDDMGYSADQTGAKATFRWEHKPLNPEAATEITAKTEDDDFVHSSFEISVESENDTPEGYYRAVVFNNLNGRMQDPVVSTTSDWIRVTVPAVVPYVTLVNAENIRLSEATETGIEVNVANLEQFRVDGADDVTYQWYFYTTEAGSDAQTDAMASRTYNEETGRYGYEMNNDIAITASARNNSSFMIPLSDAAINSASMAKFFPNSPGFYFCEVTNHYNGSATSVLSPFYNVQTA